MEDFTPHHLESLKEKGFEVVIIMEHPDKVVLMPLKNLAEANDLDLRGFRQVKTYDLELEIMAHRVGKARNKVIQLSNDFKIN